MMSQYTIYSKPSCGYCLQAKELLEQNNLDFEYLQLGTHYNLDVLMALAPNAKSLPQVFKDGVLVGGYSDLVEYLKQQY